MKELLSAIWTKFKAEPFSNFYNSISGRLYLYNAVQNATFPYAVYLFVSSVPDYTFTSTTDRAIVQFNLFSDSTEQDATEILNMRNYLTTEFDDCILSVSNYNFVKMERNIDIALIKDSDNEVWQYPVQYEVWLHK